ncbi:hypothetical protein HC823_00005, partial [Candidatus Gracilibacteria bacterium]|nr:hypothetical protein [Candidatus Gracilibacteria bacterium]
EDGIRNVLKAYNQPEGSLTSNEDFRSGVLFDFPPSASYGFINTRKLAGLLEFKSSLDLDQTETQKIMPSHPSVISKCNLLSTIFPNRNPLDVPVSKSRIKKHPGVLVTPGV